MDLSILQTTIDYLASSRPPPEPVFVNTVDNTINEKLEALAMQHDEL